MFEHEPVRGGDPSPTPDLVARPTLSFVIVIVDVIVDVIVIALVIVDVLVLVLATWTVDVYEFARGQTASPLRPPCAWM